MPHVTVKMLPGRSEAQKQDLTEAISQAVMTHAVCGIDAVSVAIEDVTDADWGPKVYDIEIAPVMDQLYKKPGYKR
jgi:4-oxalocrotonate tautomerase